MEKESTELVLSHLDKISDKIGVGVGHIWPWIVKQQYMECMELLL